jgi:hypothetical protein
MRWVLVLHLFLTPLLFAAQAIAAEPATTNRVVELKGRVLPILDSTNLQFRIEAGPTYKLLPTRDARALFADTNLHAKVLIVNGRIHPKESVLEVIGNLHTVRAGKVYELYYYCDICSIETSFPGPCLCCREDMVLLEREKKK